MAEVTLDEKSLNRLADIVAAKGAGGTTPARSEGTGFSSSGKAGKSAKEFAEQISTVGGGFKDLASTLNNAASGIPIVNKFAGALNSGVQYLENTADTFRTLSKIGGGASGQLFELRKLAADSGLSLDQFAGMVARNSELLAGFAGGVTEGEKRVAQAGQALFQDGLIEKFVNLGYSVEEAIEFNLKQTQLQRRRFMLEETSATDQAAEAARYAKSLQTISKLTGKQADQLQDEMQAAQADGAVRAKLRMLEKQGITGASKANQQAMEGMAGASSAQKLAMKEILTLGAPVSQAAKNFVAANGAAAELMYKTKAAIESGDAEGAKKLSEKSLAAAVESGDSMTNLQLATLKSVSDFGATQAEVLEETAQITDAILEQQKKMQDTNGGFVTLAEAFIQNLKNINDEVDQIARGTGDGRKALVASNKINTEIVKTQAGVQKTIAEELENNQTVNKALSTVAEDGVEVVATVGDVMKDGIEASGALFTTSMKEQVSQLKKAGFVEEANAFAEAIKNGNADAGRRALQEKGLMDAQGDLTDKVIDAATAKTKENAATSNVTTSGQSTAEQSGATPEKQKEGLIGLGKQAISGVKNFVNEVVGRETGGPLSANQLALVGEGGPELFMSNSAGRVLPNDVTQSIATLGPELGQKFSEISQQLAQEMQTMGAPMSEAAKVAAANMTAPDAASNPDLIKMMQQLVEVNRKSMDIQKSHLSQYKTALKGI